MLFPQYQSILNVGVICLRRDVLLFLSKLYNSFLVSKNDFAYLSTSD